MNRTRFGHSTKCGARTRPSRGRLARGAVRPGLRHGDNRRDRQRSDRGPL